MRGKEITTTIKDTKEGKKYANTLDETTTKKQQTNLIMQLEEKNQKYWQKKGDLKDPETGSSNTIKTGHSKIMKENPTINQENA